MVRSSINRRIVAIVLSALCALILTSRPVSAAEQPDRDRSISGHLALPEGVDSSMYGQTPVYITNSAGSIFTFARPDSEGRWRVEGLAPGRYGVVVKVSANRGSPTTYPNILDQNYSGDRASDGLVDLTTASVDGVDMTLQAGGIVAGRVTLPADAPEDWAQALAVGLRPVAGGISGSTSVSVAADGSFRADRLLHQAYTVTPKASYRSGAGRTWPVLDFDAAVTTVDLTSRPVIDDVSISLDRAPTFDITLTTDRPGELVLQHANSESWSPTSIKGIRQVVGAGTTIARFPRWAADFHIGFVDSANDDAHQWLSDADGAQTWKPSQVQAVSVRTVPWSGEFSGTVDISGFSDFAWGDGLGNELWATPFLFQRVGDEWLLMAGHKYGAKVRYANQTSQFRFDDLAAGTYAFCYSVHGPGLVGFSLMCNDTDDVVAGRYVYPPADAGRFVGVGESVDDALVSIHPVPMSMTTAFADVGRAAGSRTYSPFADEIDWLGWSGLSTGYPRRDGSPEFRPAESVTRSAMAALMYRAAGSPKVSVPSRSPFVDVSSSHPFYRAIIWMHTAKIATGTVRRDGSRWFEPSATVSREAMAAFVHRRYDGRRLSSSAPRFVDSSSSPFAADIVWLAKARVTTGTVASDGARRFEPKLAVRRDAMAAFLYRLEVLP